MEENHAEVTRALSTLQWCQIWNDVTACITNITTLSSACNDVASPSSQNSMSFTGLKKASSFWQCSWQHLLCCKTPSLFHLLCHECYLHCCGTKTPAFRMDAQCKARCWHRKAEWSHSQCHTWTVSPAVWTQTSTSSKRCTPVEEGTSLGLVARRVASILVLCGVPAHPRHCKKCMNVIRLHGRDAKQFPLFPLPPN